MAQGCVLICSVGGSHQPIVTSIKHHRPRIVHFLCSDDLGRTKGSYVQVVGEGIILRSRKDLEKPDLANIASQAGLASDQFCVHRIKGLDDLNACYLESIRVIAAVREQNLDARIVVDYTGGTKSMTAGLAAAALDDGQCEIYLVGGRRDDLVHVQDKTEFVRPVQVWDAQAMKRVRGAQNFLHRFDYAAAEHVLRDAAARFASERMLESLERGIALCRAFDAWDKFRHADSLIHLRPYQGEYVSRWRVLNNLAGEKQGHKFEWVEDLLLNAERRALQERFDDAVGRVYRAIELTAQVWLRERHGVNTSDVQIDRVPDSFRSDIERLRGPDECCKIGLLLAWDLIGTFSDPLSKLFLEHRSRIQGFLSVRNESLFAHGLRPVSSSDYSRLVPPMMVFLREAIETAISALGLRRPVILEQLPREFLRGLI